jgi:hypothetical protein
MRLLPTLAAALATAVSLSLVAAGPAQAKDGPPAPAPGTHLMLDIASAPPLSTIQAWQATSPYAAIAVYIPVDSSVDDRHDKVQANLTPGWVAAVRAGGWQVLPIYVGLQAPSKCGNAAFRHLSNKAAKAAGQGRAAAEDAVRSTRSLGISAGAPIVYDMEAYAAGCSKAMRSFYDAWTTRLHQLGARSAIYGSRASTMTDVVSLAAHGQASPDVVWAATDWGVAQTASIDPLPAGSWAGKRINQFNLSVARKYAGIAMTIDESAVDDTVWDTTAPVTTLPTLPLTTRAAKVRFDWSASDGAGSGVASFQIRTKDAGLGKSLGHWSKAKKLKHSIRTAKLARGEQWCAQVRATDRAGNTSGWSATRCTSRLADDRALSADRSWHRARAKGAYAHTTTVARHKRAVMSTRGKVKARSIGVLFRGTGTVLVKIGGHQVGVLRGHGQVWLRLTKVHHGRLQLITLSKKKVVIDGIALLRQ